MSAAPSVLIVDDERDTVEVYAQHLEAEYDVSTALSGEDALEQVDEEMDIVLLDRRMPGMSGDEVLERIRERGLDCRVVMVTAVDPDIDIVEMPFDEYLVKPATRDDLVNVIERMRARDEQEAQIREMFALASKLATLESKLDYTQLEDSEEYQTLRQEFADLRTETDLPDAADDSYLESTVEKMQALLEQDRQ